MESYLSQASKRYPAVLIQIVQVLREELQLSNVRFSKENADGRINSITDENTIIEKLQEHMKSHNIQKAPPRSWYDMTFTSDETIYHINIKCSTGGTDNALNKKAIIYSLKNLDMNTVKHNMNFDYMYAQIKHNLKPVRDYKNEYFYLYVDKNDGTVIMKSLLDIQHLTSNPINDLQINWSKEKKDMAVFHGDDIQEATTRIMSVITKSIKDYLAGCSSLLKDF